MKPHKHAELIKAWADGAEIEVYQPAFDRWEEAEPAWHTSFEYRIKPEPKPDVDEYLLVQNAYEPILWNCIDSNLKLTFDGETGELKSAEVLK